MIDQDLYIEILELFDLIKEEEIFIEYKRIEKVALEDKELLKLIDAFNDEISNSVNISYEPYLLESEQRLENIQKQLDANELYQKYNDLYKQCNDRLSYLTSLIFKDIINVGEVDCCGN